MTAFFPTPAPAPSGVVLHPLLHDPMVVVMPDDHPLATRPADHPLCLADLADDAWVTILAGHAAREQFDHACAQSGFTPRIRFQTAPAPLVPRDHPRRHHARSVRRPVSRPDPRRRAGHRHLLDRQVRTLAAAYFEYIEPESDALPDWPDLDVPGDRFIAWTLLLQSRHPAPGGASPPATSTSRPNCTPSHCRSSSPDRTDRDFPTGCETSVRPQPVSPGRRNTLGG
ncbi:LysR substrate-binding domain-containing protein [Streptomyces camelliae]|uniref:LysR substrate-binding domain-containing protein n=1 Tax=Streptomyces camelliae TaxID=3004093 RepID=UPI003D1858B7